ncbi:uncharacterized protein ACA1_246760 [Acanthamoeba castellanii str. Neff]|uniref:Uncharacterized protein n=1 Tax=Acanthamoeba castellanii (strain ATCC 30010 / Neff) TaxID=1257118 RepID=L8GL99_ACACF|nr:uncharacterized protein ACA1_246760 [Acanthamoeba castellanii str. Neff]ELR13493.1 hypothetical protein ACA1_246760 [Acanthamoeba castellanii str. Neff]
MRLAHVTGRACRPSFDKYYKQLHKLHDISADAFEISDQESEGESEDEMALEGLSYEEWQMKRIKDEVKSFMKQLITERNDDFELVARANTAAFTELKEAFDGVGSEEESDDSDESYDSSGDGDDGDQDNEGHLDQKKKKKQKDYLENELLFAESGEVGPGLDVAAAAPHQLPVSHYVEVQQPRNPPTTSTPTISYAELGRSPSTGGEASPQAGSPVVPSSDYAVLASSSQRRANKRTKAKTKETTKAKRDGDHPAQAQQLPASQYVDLGLKKAAGGPPPEQPQQPLPQEKSQVFDSAYITLEPRNAADATITMTAKDWKERAQREGGTSGTGVSPGKVAGNGNGYEEITTPTGAAIGHRPQDAGYYGL